MKYNNMTRKNEINEAICNSSYTKHITDYHIEYYDNYDSLCVLELKSPHTKDTCYGLYRNEYDANHRLIQVMSIGTAPFHLTKYFYYKEKLVRKEEFIAETDLISSHIVMECDGYKFFPNTISYYYYNTDGSMQQEIVTLPTGDISCFIDYSNQSDMKTIVNPFKTIHKWSIEWISKGTTIRAVIRQGYYSIPVLEDIAKTIHAYYPLCETLYVGCYFTCTHTDYSFQDMYALCKQYQEKYGIHISCI